MASIGTFKKSGHEFQGEIVTLSLQTKGVRIVPESNRPSDNAPSHRVYVGRAEIGAAWSKRSSEGRDYLSVKLDDPSFTAPIYANLFDDEDAETYTLIWSRSRKPNGDWPQQAPPGSAGRGPRAARWTNIPATQSTHLSLCRPRSDAQSLSRHACWRSTMLHAPSP